MSSFTQMRGLFSKNSAAVASPRRKARIALALESLEGRALMSVVTGPPVSQPPPVGTMPPIHVGSPSGTLPPSYL